MPEELRDLSKNRTTYLPGGPTSGDRGALAAHTAAGFTADVLATNAGMLRVFHRSGYPVESRLEDGVYTLRIPFQKDEPGPATP